MFNSWAEVREAKFQYINGRPRRPHERHNPYPEGTRHIKFLSRERAAMIKIRRQGVSMNQIAVAFGRSVSEVHRVIKNAESLGILRRFSNRKLPQFIRKRTASFRRQTLMKLLDLWVDWICGRREKPP
jgi:hypothetical protein